MANWASVSYRIEGDREILTKIKNIFEEYMNGTRLYKEGGCSTWCGNLFDALGIDIPKNYYMRSFINYIDLWERDDVLQIESEEAWGLSDFSTLLQKSFDGLNVLYICEEPGMEIYITNDEEGVYFPCRYSVEVCVDGNGLYEDFVSKEELNNWLHERYGTDYDHIAEWEEAQGKTCDNYISVHEYQIIND